MAERHPGLTFRHEDVGQRFWPRARSRIFLVTGDLSEALALADRIAVMFEGRVVETFPADDQARVGRIGQMMAGMDADDDA